VTAQTPVADVRQALQAGLGQLQGELRTLPAKTESCTAALQEMLGNAEACRAAVCAGSPADDAQTRSFLLKVNDLACSRQKKFDATLDEHLVTESQLAACVRAAHTALASQDVDGQRSALAHVTAALPLCRRPPPVSHSVGFRLAKQPPRICGMEVDLDRTFVEFPAVFWPRDEHCLQNAFAVHFRDSDGFGCVWLKAADLEVTSTGEDAQYVSQWHQEAARLDVRFIAGGFGKQSLCISVRVAGLALRGSPWTLRPRVWDDDAIRAMLGNGSPREELRSAVRRADLPCVLFLSIVRTALGKQLGFQFFMDRVQRHIAEQGDALPFELVRDVLERLVGERVDCTDWEPAVAATFCCRFRQALLLGNTGLAHGMFVAVWPVLVQAATNNAPEEFVQELLRVADVVTQPWRVHAFGSLAKRSGFARRALWLAFGEHAGGPELSEAEAVVEGLQCFLVAVDEEEEDEEHKKTAALKLELLEATLGVLEFKQAFISRGVAASMLNTRELVPHLARLLGPAAFEFPPGTPGEAVRSMLTANCDDVLAFFEAMNATTEGVAFLRKLAGDSRVHWVLGVGNREGAPVCWRAHSALLLGLLDHGLVRSFVAELTWWGWDAWAQRREDLVMLADKVSSCAVSFGLVKHRLRDAALHEFMHMGTKPRVRSAALRLCSRSISAGALCPAAIRLVLARVQRLVVSREDLPGEEDLLLALEAQAYAVEKADSLAVRRAAAVSARELLLSRPSPRLFCAALRVLAQTRLPMPAPVLAACSELLAEPFRYGSYMVCAAALVHLHSSTPLPNQRSILEHLIRLYDDNGGWLSGWLEVFNHPSNVDMVGSAMESYVDAGALACREGGDGSCLAVQVLHVHPMAHPVLCHHAAQALFANSHISWWEYTFWTRAPRFAIQLMSRRIHAPRSFPM